MRVVYTVFCVLSVAYAASKKSECGGKTITVTINKGYEPYWFQAYFNRCFRGDTVPDISVYTIHVSSPLSYYGLQEISNFPLLRVIYLDNIDASRVPHLSNLPKIEKISLASNKLTAIEDNKFAEIPIKEIVLSRNTITTIGSGAFGDNVQTIYLTCNNISEISPTWFKNPTSIKMLKLGGNNIANIPDNMFKDFLNLEDLELRNNQITTLGVGSISGPTYMNSLHLSYNKISEIKAEVFGPKINITNFNVEYNRLSFLHQAMMDKMTARNILLWGNPWQCPCQKFLDAWITKNNEHFSQGLPRDEDPSCVTALSFRDKCIPFVDDDLYETFLTIFEISPFQFC